MSLYHLLPPLFRWEDIPDPFEELIHPLDSDTPEDLTPVLLPFTSEQSKTKDSSKDGIFLLEADVMDDFSPVLHQRMWGMILFFLIPRVSPFL